MPDVNWKQRNASEAMIEDVLWWMETFDLDGGRIDAVKHVDDLAITNLAVRINERFETVGTDMYLKGETAMGWAGHDLAANANEYGTINRYIGEHQLDGQADFVLYHATSDRVFTGGEENYMHLDYWTAAARTSTWTVRSWCPSSAATTSLASPRAPTPARPTSGTSGPSRPSGPARHRRTLCRLPAGPCLVADHSRRTDDLHGR